MARRPTRAQAVTALLSALPALVLAIASWVQADAAKKSEEETYQGAALTIGYQAEEIMLLEKRLSILEHMVYGKSGPTIQGNTFNTAGGAGIAISDKLPGGPRDPKYFGQ